MVQIKGSWDCVSCDCLMLETVGIPCSHIFSVMKAENMKAIPKCIVSTRWTKEAKLEVCSQKTSEISTAAYMSMEARLGLLHAACRNLQRLAYNSDQAFHTAIAEIHSLTLRLEALKCDKGKGKSKGDLGVRNHVQDPVIVLTKGCRKKKKKIGPPHERRCSRCSQPGHTVRKCKATEGPMQTNVNCTTQSNQFMCQNYSVMSSRGHGVRISGETPVVNNRVNAEFTRTHSTNDFSIDSDSEAWYQQFHVGTDNESNEDTSIQGFLPNYDLGVCSTSTYATNYGHIWRPQG